jgi:hypothetical protein
LVEGSGVTLDTGDAAGPLLALDSQRFAADSWFTAGLDSYIERMLEAPLIAT